jgi:hypothetical protein
MQLLHTSQIIRPTVSQIRRTNYSLDSVLTRSLSYEQWKLCSEDEICNKSVNQHNITNI